jgi:mono/diheme cytochrome c family protein
VDKHPSDRRDKYRIQVLVGNPFAGLIFGLGKFLDQQPYTHRNISPFKEQSMKRTCAALSFLVAITLLQGCGGESEQSVAAPAASNDAAAFAKARGKAVYSKTCFACHGEGGVGVEGLGKNWITSEFIANSTDQELIDFIKVGRDTDDPMSAGIAPMPPYGGNPMLTDEDLTNVVAYMRSLHE